LLAKWQSTQVLIKYQVGDLASSTVDALERQKVALPRMLLRVLHAMCLVSLPSTGRCAGYAPLPLCASCPVKVVGEGEHAGTTVIVKWDLAEGASNAVALRELCALGEQPVEQCEKLRQQISASAVIFLSTPSSDAASPASRAQLFDAIYATRFWGSEGDDRHGISSGKGSRPGRGVATLRRTLRDAARGDFGAPRPIRTVLEIGCGDGAWLGGDPIAPLLADLGVEIYRGVDVSAVALARRSPHRNSSSSSSDGDGGVDIELIARDAVSGPLNGIALRSTRVAVDGGWDLVVIRDVHGHLLPSEILALYRNIAATAKPRLVLAKTHTRRAATDESGVSGALANGRRVNLLRKPYCFEDPERLDRESERGAFMALWNAPPSPLPDDQCD
jgi:hypothetical protein